jgi:hypothetical protein
MSSESGVASQLGHSQPHRPTVGTKLPGVILPQSLYSGVVEPKEEAGAAVDVAAAAPAGLQGTLLLN